MSTKPPARNINISLTTEQAQRFLPLLESVSAQSKGADAKALGKWVAELKQKAVDREALALEEQREAQAQHEISKLTKRVVKALPQIKHRGLSPEVMAFSKTILRLFDNAETRMFKATEKHRQARVANGHSYFSDLPPLELMKVLDPLGANIEQAIAELKASKPAPFVVSEDYTLSAQRAKLAKRCVITAMDQAREAVSFDNLPDVVACFKTMDIHLKVGVALLEGNPSKIKTPFDLDSTAAEALDGNVWEFMDEVDTGDSELQKVPASKSHKPKR